MTDETSSKSVKTSNTSSGDVSTTTVTKDATTSSDDNTSIEGGTPTTSKDVETIPAPPDNGPY